MCPRRKVGKPRESSSSVLDNLYTRLCQILCSEVEPLLEVTVDDFRPIFFVLTYVQGSGA
jgi:hypothetical protein